MVINEKKIEKILKEQRKEYQRYLGVVAKDFESKIGIVADQYFDVKKILALHTEMIGKLVMDVEIIKTDIEFIKSGLKKKVDIEEFEALERRVLFLEKKNSRQN